ncbi:uncharacterized protein LOC126335816 [Schistocerca gregaria]|uniref:uncharacterized protein LOC126335816 n=1 Tax=Schistocerca gregaria TaxID=7010 RepID=UPI00211E90D5|nr:uncharacterized protein LOC126335816 [Schistocerca gregaria]
MGPHHHHFHHSSDLAKLCNLGALSTVIPVYKSGDKFDIKNFRPLPLLPVLSKIIERIMHDGLLDFLNKNKILVNAQNDFRNGKSTQTALFSFLKLVYKAVEDKELICGLLMDLSKAFDLINHNLLLLKIYNYHVCGISYEWFKSFLTERKQSTNYSGWKCVPF